MAIVEPSNTNAMRAFARSGKPRMVCAGMLSPSATVSVTGIPFDLKGK